MVGRQLKPSLKLHFCLPVVKFIEAETLGPRIPLKSASRLIEIPKKKDDDDVPIFSFSGFLGGCHSSDCLLSDINSVEYKLEAPRQSIFNKR